MPLAAGGVHIRLRRRIRRSPHTRAGQVDGNNDPSPMMLETTMSPPDCFAKPKAWRKPRPVPRPTSFVVKKGSKIVCRRSAGMPVPVSSTEMAT